MERATAGDYVLSHMTKYITSKTFYTNSTYLTKYMYLSGFLCPIKILRLSYDSLREQSKEEKEEEKTKFVDVPVSLKGHVIGKGGHKLHEIMETTGTRLVSQSKEEAGFTIFGDEEQIAHAERLIKGIVVKC